MVNRSGLRSRDLAEKDLLRNAVNLNKNTVNVNNFSILIMDEFSLKFGEDL
jgi:hypothetical protein